MQISLERFMKLSPISLRLLCAPVSHHDACLITLCEDRQLISPVIASDGRMYDSIALQQWFMTNTAQSYPHVVPGCPINFVTVNPWPLAACRLTQELMKSSCNSFAVGMRRVVNLSLRFASNVRIFKRKKVRSKKAPLWKNVIAYHQNRIKFRGRCEFRHAPASPFIATRVS